MPWRSSRPTKQAKTSIRPSRSKHNPTSVFGTVIGSIDDIKIYEVDGDYVRDHYDVEFALGGHYYRYSFIPIDEIWVERTKDINDTIVHEYTEYNEMRYKNKTYNSAHKIASKVERMARDD